MINIAVCDDDAADRREITERIRCFMKENSLHMEIVEYESGAVFLEEYAWQYDIVILDIELGREDGIHVAKKIRERDEDVLILFATNYTDYAYDSFSADPVGYIQKSESYEVFASVLKKIIGKISSRKEKIVFACEGVTTPVSIGKIEYLEYHNREVVAKRIDGSFEKTKETLKSVLENDKKGMLLQINRDVAVNLIWIEACGNGMVIMRPSHKKFRIATRRKRFVEDTYLKYLRDRMIDIGS